MYMKMMMPLMYVHFMHKLNKLITKFFFHSTYELQDTNHEVQNNRINRTGECKAIENGVECGEICGIQRQDFGEYCEKHETSRQLDYKKYKKHGIKRKDFEHEMDDKMYALSWAEELRDRIFYQKKYNCPYHPGHRIKNDDCRLYSRRFFVVNEDTFEIIEVNQYVIHVE